MTAVLGFLMVATFMTLIMTKRLPALVALILVPTIFGLIAGDAFGLSEMMLEGVKKVAPTGVMLMFAILYFGLMIDVGLFDPVVRALLAVMRGDPVRVVVGTVALATFVSLDGDGSTTYMVTTAALLPLYKRLGLNPLIMASLIMLSSGVLNITPWGGPTARVASALQVDAGAVFAPLTPAMAVAIVFLLGLAYLYGLSEKRRLGKLSLDAQKPIGPQDPGKWNDQMAGIADLSLGPDGKLTVSTDAKACRPHLFWINCILTITLLTLLVIGIAPLPLLFMVGFGLAALINYPDIDMLKARIATHAPNVLAVVSLVFAAGIFTGVLSGAGMMDAMARSIVAMIPEWMGPYIASITALLSLPMTFFMSNDAFYYGMVPILAETGAHYGISREAIASASLIGQPVHLLSPLVPSTYLLVNLSGVELADHQRFTVLTAIAVCAVMFAVAVCTGVFPFSA